MPVKTRGFILAGQIITLVVASFMMFGSFILVRYYNANHLQELATTSTIIGFVSLAFIPISICGIIHSRKPVGDFPNWAAILSILYCAVCAVFEIIGGIQLIGNTELDISIGLYTLAYILAVIFLIIGLVKAYKEQTLQTKDTYSLFARSPSMGQGNYVPAAVVSTVSNAVPQTNTPEQSPEGNKIAQDLADLKKLFDSGLITEDEYNIKKQDILNRFFPK